MIKYVFWDSDNTLIDTFALHWAKHVETLKSLGIVLSDDYKTKVHHNNGQQNWEWIRDELGLSLDQDDYLSRIDAYYKSNSDKLKLMTGIHECLDLFKSNGIKQCVVSNGRRSSVLPAHDALNTNSYFEFILCKEDYVGRKPEPTPYLTAMQKMSDIIGVQINPDECLSLEDDPLGVEAAKRAGLTTIFRPTPLVPPQCEYADYTVMDDNLIDVIKPLI